MTYIPRAHNKFYVWQGDFYSRVSEKQGSFAIDVSKFKALTEAQHKYIQAFDRASNPDEANRADRVERNEREAEYIRVIRNFVNENVRYNSRVSDYDRKYLGLVVPDKKPTPAAIPETHPLIEVDFSETRVHKLRMKDERTKSTAKPAGVRDAEIWAKVGGKSPSENSELTLVGSSSNGKLRLNYELSQLGEKVYYQARWVNTRSQPGEFGPIVMAVIA